MLKSIELFNYKVQYNVGTFAEGSVEILCLWIWGQYIKKWYVYEVFHWHASQLSKSLTQEIKGSLRGVVIQSKHCQMLVCVHFAIMPERSDNPISFHVLRVSYTCCLCFFGTQSISRDFTLIWKVSGIFEWTSMRKSDRTVFSQDIINSIKRTGE